MSFDGRYILALPGRQNLASPVLGISSRNITDDFVSGLRLEDANREIGDPRNFVACGWGSRIFLLERSQFELTFSRSRVELAIVCCSSSWPGSTCSLTIE